MFLLSERETDEEVKSAADLETKIEVYDRIIKDCIEALVAVKDDLKGDEVSDIILSNSCLKMAVIVLLTCWSFL